MEIDLAVRMGIVASGVFLVLGMLTGVIKYLQMRQSENARAHYYTDIAHRASLMYAGSTLILSVMAYFSAWSDVVNLLCIVGNIVFFALAILSYLIHGLLKDTNNQFKQPHQISKWHLPTSLMTLFMMALIIVEVGCTLVLLMGTTKTLLLS